MDDLSKLRDLRNDLPRPDEAQMREIRGPLDRVIRASQAHRAGGFDRVRGWLPPNRAVRAAGAIVAMAGVAAALVVLLSSDDAVVAPDVTYIEGALLEFPQATANDVVAHADQLSVVTAVEVPGIDEIAPDPPSEKDGGLVVRDVKFRVDSNVWDDVRPVAKPGEEFLASRGGWIFRSVDDGPKVPFEFVVEGGVQIKQGAQYLVPLSRTDGGRLELTMPQAEFPYVDSEVRPGKTQDSPLAAEMKGKSAEQAGSELAAIRSRSTE